MSSKRIAVVLAVVAFAGGLNDLAKASEAESNTIACVRSVLRSVVDGLPQRRSGTCGYLREFGFRNRNSSAYRNMAAVVSNCFETVISNFGACASNDLERMVLMSAGWAYDDDYYLQWYTNLVNLVENGVVSQSELKWYNEGSGSEWRMNLLALRYDVPGVSNVVYKLQGVTGNTNYYQKVLNGESRRLYLEYKAEIEYEHSSVNENPSH